MESKPTKSYIGIKIIIALLTISIIAVAVIVIVHPDEVDNNVKPNNEHVQTKEEKDATYLKGKTYQHYGPTVAAGYNDIYYFDENKEYYYFTSEMDGETRLKAEKGTWAINNNKLVMTATKQLTAINGNLVDSFGSYATDKTLIDYDLEVKTVNNPKEYIYKILKYSDVNKDNNALYESSDILRLGDSDDWYLGGYDYKYLSTDNYKLYVESLNGDDKTISNSNIGD